MSRKIARGGSAGRGWEWTAHLPQWTHVANEKKGQSASFTYQTDQQLCSFKDVNVEKVMNCYK